MPSKLYLLTFFISFSDAPANHYYVLFCFTQFRQMDLTALLNTFVYFLLHLAKSLFPCGKPTYNQFQSEIPFSLHFFTCNFLETDHASTASCSKDELSSNPSSSEARGHVGWWIAFPFPLETRSSMIGLRV